MENSNSESQQPGSETLVDLTRMGGLSDAVFAVAMTLLVLDIRIPEGISSGQLPASLLELAPKVLVYLISFVVIGGAWGSHQRMLRQITRGDGLLVWFNLFFLLFITLLPASAVLLGRYPATFLAIAVFAADVILIQLSALLFWRHASKNELIDLALDQRMVVGIGRRLGILALGFVLVAPLAFISANLVYVFWIVLFLLNFTTDWLSWQVAASTRQASIPLDSAKQAYIHMRHAAGRLHLDALSSDETLLSGLFAGGVQARICQAADRHEIKLRTPGTTGFLSMVFPWAWSFNNRLNWDIHLNDGLPIDLDIVTAAGEVELDLSEVCLQSLKLTTSASSSIIHLPARMPHTRLEIEASIASFVFYVPPGVAVRLQGKKAFSSIEVDPERYLVPDGKGPYTSLDYETVASRVEVNFELTFGSITVIETP